MKLTTAELQFLDVASTFRWSVSLDNIGLQSPKGTYIPATNVEETITGSSTTDITLGNMRVQIPNTITTPSIALTFIDDKDYTIHKQLVEWINQVHSQGRIHFSKKKSLIVFKYDNQDNVVWHTSYEVLPAMDVKFLGDSTAGLLTNTINLLVLNKIN